MSSIRKRIIVRVIGLLILGSVLLGFFSYLDAAHEVEELFDAQLAQSARVLAGLLNEPVSQIDHDELTRILVETASSHPDIGHPYEAKVAYMVRDASEQVIAASFSAPDPVLLDWTPGFSTLTRPDSDWRAYVLNQRDASLSIWVGERSDIRDETVSRIVLGTIVPDLIGIPLMLLLVWAAIGSGLKPLDRLAQQVRSRDTDSLVPLTESDLPQEVAPMQSAINRLLSQVEQLLSREQRFIADAAHELRTPLAVMKVHLNNARSASDPSTRQESMQHLHDAVERATRLVSQMLELARLSDTVVVKKLPVNVYEEARMALSDIMPLALQKEQVLELESSGRELDAQAFEPGALKTLLQNVVGNAITHTPHGTRIVVRISTDGQQWCLSTHDSGPGVAEDDRAQLADRFFSRGDTNGTGLGLSIVQRIVQRHQATMTLGTSDLGGLLVQICFPDNRIHQTDITLAQNGSMVHNRSGGYD
ncbi:MAG: two-component sensor histidine kinase [Gammaproteobacteria bacterium]|nr:two-component sensor histidine kinase [Gammaproteobacteria bacterium]